MEDPPEPEDLPDPLGQTMSAPEDSWWHYAGALALVAAIVALGIVGLQVSD